MTREELEQRAREFWTDYAEPDFSVEDYEPHVQDMFMVLLDVHNAALEEAADLYDENAGANDQQMIRALKVKP